MKVHIHEAGDPMVGIPSVEHEFEVPIDTELDAEERERIRKLTGDYLTALWDDGSLGIRFDDECPDCITVHERPAWCPVLDGVFE